MECITSRENPIIKQYRKLSQSRGEREEQSLFVMEGARLCADAAASGVEIVSLLVSPDGERYPEQVKLLDDCAQRSYAITSALAGAISDTEHPQGIFAIGRTPPQPSQLPESGRLILLDHLQDPGNLGTIIRTADALGINAILLSEGCPDCFSPKVIRAAMGSCFRARIYRENDLASAILLLRQKGMRCYAATLTPDAVPLQKLPVMPFGGIVIGNEGNGVSQPVIDCCDSRVYIPMSGNAESLNAAVAASLCIWELSGKYND